MKRILFALLGVAAAVLLPLVWWYVDEYGRPYWKIAIKR